MAKIMQYTNDQGVNFFESYWRITNIKIDTIAKIAAINFLGYKDEGARKSSKMPVGAHNYVIRGPEFDLAYGEVVAKSKNIIEIAYDYATNYKDLDKDVEVVDEKTGERYVIKEKVSFFDGAFDDIKESPPIKEILEEPIP